MIAYHCAQMRNAGLLVALLAFPYSSVHASPLPAKSGLVVVEFGPDNALEKAGVRIGDILHSWERAPSPPANLRGASGRLDTFFDWFWLTNEEVPRGAIRLKGERNGEPWEIGVLPGRWLTIVRPLLDAPGTKYYQEIRDLVRLKDFDAVEKALNDWFQEHQETLPPATRWWLCNLGGEFASRGGNEERARIWFTRALEQTSDPLAQIHALQSIGVTYQAERDYTQAEELYRKALIISERLWGDNLITVTSLKAIYLLAWWQKDDEKLQERVSRLTGILAKHAPDSLLQADHFNVLGLIANRSGNFEQARSHHEKALAIRQRLDPGSINVSESLTNLGNVYFRTDDLPNAFRLYTEAREILEKKAPEGKILPTVYSNLGRIHSALGEFEKAEAAFLKASVLHPKNNPNAMIEVITTYNSLSILAQRRGDLAQAEEWSQQVVRDLRRIAPKTPEMMGALRTLGTLRYHLGDLDRAADYFREALQLSKESSPDEADQADALYMLGRVIQTQGELKKAEELYLEALTLHERLNPGNMASGAILHNLGDLYRSRKDFPTALTYLRKALSIQAANAPSSIDTVVSLKQIGMIAREMDQPEEALRLHHRALEIIGSIAPGTSIEADILYEASRDLQRLGRGAESLAMLRRCISALDAQFRKLGGDENRTSFKGRFATYYKAFIDTLHQEGSPEETFQAVEAYRAQSFLVLMQERDLIFSDVPYELETERRRLAADYDAIQQQLFKPEPIPPEKRGASEQRLRETREQQVALSARIRSLSPKLASLRYPEPLAASEVQASLDEGTSLISFSVGEEETLAFVLSSATRLHVYRINVGNDELQRRTTDFISLLKAETLRSPRRAVFQEVSRQLYRLLFKPAEWQLGQAKRLLVLPDGPLHALPFSALIRDTPDRKWQYLAEWKPLHFALSATVYSQIKKTRRGGQGADTATLFVAFGDPWYPEELRAAAAESIADPQVSRSARDFRFDLLPWTAREVSEIASVFSDRAKIYLRQDATEAQAKSVGSEAKYLHFATHGRVEKDFPLNSSVVLSIPRQFIYGKDNGLLQAWEIFERVRIDADLVVLSACESGLGKEMGGEGLIGLTRAFQYAGARSVMASLWKISDRTTAELMVRFYKHLKAGKPKDEALRAAQMELIRGPIQVKNEKGEIEEIDASAPYYWAAFQIYGDWQ